MVGKRRDGGDPLPSHTERKEGHVVQIDDGRAPDGSGGGEVSDLVAIRARRLLPFLRGPVEVYRVCDEDPWAWVLKLHLGSGACRYLSSLKGGFEIVLLDAGGERVETEVIHLSNCIGISAHATVRSAPRRIGTHRPFVPIAIEFAVSGEVEDVTKTIRFRANWHPEKWSRST